MQKRYHVAFHRTCQQPSQRDQLRATAAVSAMKWFIYRATANKVAHDAQADYIASQIDALLYPNAPNASGTPPRFDLWQRYDKSAAKEADEFWTVILKLAIEDLRKR